MDFIQLALVGGNTSPLLREIWARWYWPGDMGFFLRGTRAAIEGNLWPAFSYPQVGLWAGAALFAGAAGSRRWELFAAAVSPFALAMLAGTLKLYPFGYDRFVLHLMASLVLFAALAVDELPACFQTGLVVLTVAGLLAIAFQSVYWEPRFPDGTAAALEYLRDTKKASRADLLYVHATAEETFRYYERDIKWKGPELLGPSRTGVWSAP